MTVARNLISRALRQIQVVDPTETPTAQQMNDALDALNQMMHGWKSEGVDVSHVDMTLDDAFSIPDEFIEATTALLAARLAAEYPGAVVPSTTTVLAVNGWEALLAAYVPREDRLTVDRALRPQRFGRRWP